MIRREKVLEAMRCTEKIMISMRVFSGYCDRPLTFLNVAVATRVAGALELFKLADQEELLIAELGPERAWARVDATFISAAVLAIRQEELAVMWATKLAAFLSVGYKAALTLLNVTTGARDVDEDAKRFASRVAPLIFRYGAGAELFTKLKPRPGLVLAPRPVRERILRRQDEAVMKHPTGSNLLELVRAAIKAGAEEAERALLNPSDDDEMVMSRFYMTRFRAPEMKKIPYEPSELSRRAVDHALKLVREPELEPETGWPTEDWYRIWCAFKYHRRKAEEYLLKIRELRTKPRPHFV